MQRLTIVIFIKLERKKIQQDISTFIYEDDVERLVHEVFTPKMIFMISHCDGQTKRSLLLLATHYSKPAAILSNHEVN